MFYSGSKYYWVCTSLPAVRDCNSDPVFSIPGFGIGESLIPGCRRDYRDSVTRDSSVLNPGIKINWYTGLQALDYRLAIISRSHRSIRKINCFACIFGNDRCKAINRI